MVWLQSDSWLLKTGTFIAFLLPVPLQSDVLLQFPRQPDVLRTRQPDTNLPLPLQTDFSQTSSGHCPTSQTSARLHLAICPTSQTLSGQVPHQPNIIRPIALPARLHPAIALPARLHPDIALPARLHPAIAPPARLHLVVAPPARLHPDIAPLARLHPNIAPPARLHPNIAPLARLHPNIAPPARLQQVFMRPLLRQPDFSQTSSDPCPAYQSINSFAWPSRAAADSITLSLLWRCNCDTPAAWCRMISQPPGPGIHQLTVPSLAPCASLEALTPLLRRFSLL